MKEISQGETENFVRGIAADIKARLAALKEAIRAEGLSEAEILRGAGAVAVVSLSAVEQMFCQTLHDDGITVDEVHKAVKIGIERANGGYASEMNRLGRFPTIEEFLDLMSTKARARMMMGEPNPRFKMDEPKEKQ